MHIDFLDTSYMDSDMLDKEINIHIINGSGHIVYKTEISKYQILHFTIKFTHNIYEITHIYVKSLIFLIDFGMAAVPKSINNMSHGTFVGYHMNEHRRIT